MERIDANVKRGSAELAVLALLRSGPLYGYEIAKQIELQTGGQLKFDVASLYPLLYRMETRGWVEAYWEKAASGRRRRYYRLSSTGKKKLVVLRSQWAEFFRALNQVAEFENV
jgi:PadR family transcriptional regulator, regulatory protein PadR